MNALQKRIAEAYAACYRLCEPDHQACQWLERALDAARRGETEHRRMGSRFVQKPTRDMYKLPVADAARFFVVKWFLTEANGYGQPPTSYEDACSLREDTLYGYGARDRVRGIIDKVGKWQALKNEYADVAGLDYSEVFAA